MAERRDTRVEDGVVLTNFVYCRIEGCPRATMEGQDKMCGLAKIYGVAKAPDVPECGSSATVDAWFKENQL